ncbi:MAG: hypothetical protein PHD48_11585 [Alphaproteobacteria bacterium]|nr:hypothetical protein [Alphaproteobacteria bacterium]
MKIAEIIKPDSRVWIKPEWGPLSDNWPAVSFTFYKVADDLANDFRMDRDLMISIGTTNSLEVEPEYRSKLLSVTRFASKQVLRTSKIVPQRSWEEAQKNYPGQWTWGFPISELWELDPYIDAHKVCPKAYKMFAVLRGKPVELEKDEIERLLNLTLEKMTPSFTNNAKTAIGQQTLSELDAATKRELWRATQLVLQRINSGGDEQKRLLPIRSTSPDIDLNVCFSDIWKKQEGICPLCLAPIEIEPENKLMQMSADRIVSENGMYDENNMHITHLACNLAKNKFSVEDFHEWLEVAATNYLSKTKR